MIRLIDNVLNRITMYRVVLYYLIFLVAVAAAFSVFGFLPFQPLDLLASTAVLVLVCWIANSLLAKIFRVPANAESLYITAFILALIITPRSFSRHFAAGSALLVWAGVLAMASKYVLAVRRKHLFNPAAVAVVLTALTLNDAASWWVGTLPMMPFVLVGGLLVARKVARFDLILSFVGAACAVTLGTTLAKGTGVLPATGQLLADTPLLFFVFAMLTEPLTTPPVRTRRVVYGAVVGCLFASPLHFGQVFVTPELALIVGNALSYVMSPKARYLLRLEARTQLAPDVYEFRFTGDRRLRFRPGQYLEWTLAHPRPDSRGNRRYFTIASAPTEDHVRLGVKFYNPSSTFKRALASMKIGGKISAAHLAGAIAGYTRLPVLGVPIPSSELQGLDSLLSTAQMPSGVPVGTLAIGVAGARNAALLAAAIVALSDEKIRKNLEAFRKKQTESVLAAQLPK